MSRATQGVPQSPPSSSSDVTIARPSQTRWFTILPFKEDEDLVAGEELLKDENKMDSLVSLLCTSTLLLARELWLF